MFHELTELPCLWENLKNESRPIFLYGTGNGADKILDVCEEYEIKIAGVFASGGFVRSRNFRGMPVRSIESVVEEFGDDIVVLLAFGTTLDNVIENINKIAASHTLYIPEVPLYDSPLFDREFYVKNYDLITAADALFEDDESRQVYRDMILFRLTGEGKYLSRVTSMSDMYSELIDSSAVDRVIDCGAYKGDSALDLINSLSPVELIAFEPDPKTFLKLSAFADSVTDRSVTAYNYAVGAFEATAEFNSSGSRGSGAEGSNKRGRSTEVGIKSLDSFNFTEVDLIKFDVEGDEAEAIEGAKELIKGSDPALSVSVYHRSGDLFQLPLLISKLCPDHKLYLRRVPCIPAWDISLVAVPKRMVKA